MNCLKTTTSATRVAPTTSTTTLQDAERDQQLLDGLREADRLLVSTGTYRHALDLSSLVTLRTLEWLSDEMTVAEIRTRLVSLQASPEIH